MYNKKNEATKVNINDLITKETDSTTGKESIKTIQPNKKEIVKNIMIELVKNEKTRNRVA
jgi:hypothetical protein